MIGSLLAFIAVATLVIVTPGPDSLLVLRNTVRGGYSGGLATAAGVTTGLVLWGGVAAVGLSALLDASRIGHNVLHIAGAIYLVWLGITSFRGHADLEPPDQDLARTEGRRAPVARMYALGLLSNILNPKIGVFFIAFLPGFVPAGTHVGMFTLILGLVFALETGTWLAALSWMTTRGVAWFRRPRIRKTLDRLTGAAFIAFGIRLATDLR